MENHKLMVRYFMKKACRDTQLSIFICRSHSIVTRDVFLPFLCLKDTESYTILYTQNLILIRCSCEILMLARSKMQQPIRRSRKQAKTISDVAPLNYYCIFMNGVFSLTLTKNWRGLRVKSFQILPDLN